MKTRVKDNPKLRERVLTDGKKALFLEYYLGRTSTPKTDEQGNPLRYTTGKMTGKPVYEVRHIRKKEELKLYLYTKPRTPEERTHNTNALALAKQIRNTREQELLSGTMGYNVVSKNENVVACFENYLATYTKKDVRNVRSQPFILISVVEINRRIVDCFWHITKVDVQHRITSQM